MEVLVFLMQIKFHSAVLITNKYEIMKKFYSNVLEQEIEFDFGNCSSYKCGLSIWQLQPYYPLTDALGRQFSEKGNNNLELCFETDEFQSVVEKIRTHEIEYLHDVTEEKWGQLTLRIFDPDNNIVEIGETIPCFVNRFHKQGMNAEQINERTSVPIEAIKQITNQ